MNARDDWHEGDGHEQHRRIVRLVVVAAVVVVVVATAAPALLGVTVALALLAVPVLLLSGQARARAREKVESGEVAADSMTARLGRWRQPMPAPEPVVEPWRSERWICEQVTRGMREIYEWLAGPAGSTGQAN